MFNDYCENGYRKSGSQTTYEQSDRFSVEAFFSGCEGGGGNAAFGSLVRFNGDIVYQNSGYCGRGPEISKNVAEYGGAIDALTKALKYPGTVTLRSNSKLAIMQLGPDLTYGEKRWKAKDGLYLPYYKKAIRLVNQHRDRMLFHWIPWHRNIVCNELAKGALQNGGLECCIQPEPLLNDSDAARCLGGLHPKTAIGCEGEHQLPPYELSIQHELIHQHDCCCCGNTFLWEDRHRELGDKGCEECEIASKRVTPSTNRERLLDCLDDRAVIEEMKLQIDREFAFASLQWESGVYEPWGGAFRNRRARKHTKHSQPKSRRSHSVIVQRTLAGREENA